LSGVFNKSGFNWVSLFDEYIDYPDKLIKMRMIVSKKKPLRVQIQPRGDFTENSRLIHSANLKSRSNHRL